MKPFVAAIVAAAISLPMVAAAQQPAPPAGGTPVAITGTLTGDGFECPAMRGDDGQLYTLAGGLGAFKIGDRVVVRGAVAQVSNCMQGITIQVQSITRPLT